MLKEGGAITRYAFRRRGDMSETGEQSRRRSTIMPVQRLTLSDRLLREFGAAQDVKRRGSYAEIVLLPRFTASHQGQTPLMRS